MRRRATALIATAAALSVALPAGAPARPAAPVQPVAPARAAADAPARMLVYAQEWSLWPSRTTLPAGKVEVQLLNRGQDAHDLRIRRLSHGRMNGSAQDVAATQSGALNQGGWYLKPGRYELYCSMPGHLKKGMHTMLTVS